MNWRGSAWKEAPGGPTAPTPEQVRLTQFKDYTQLCHLQTIFITTSWGYVGDLKFNRTVWFQCQELHAAEVAALLAPDDRRPVQVGEKCYWYFTKTITAASGK